MKYNKINKLFFLIISLLILIAFYNKINAPLAEALDLNPLNYFDIEYNTELSKTDVQENEAFNLSIEGRAICIKVLPVGVNQVELTLEVRAFDKNSDTELILADDFVISVEPFPNQKNNSSQFIQSIDIAFPPDSDYGKYDILGQLVNVQIDGWDITEFISPEILSFNFGALTYSSSLLPSSINRMLIISPKEVDPGEDVTIEVQLRNNTSVETYYPLEISINGFLEESREITLAPLENKTIHLVINKYEEGDYIVS